MLQISNSILLGVIEDNNWLFYAVKTIGKLSGCTDLIGYPTGYCRDVVSSNQPISDVIAFILAHTLSPLLAYNIMVIIGLLGTALTSYLVFRNLVGKYIALILSATFVLSPFFLYQHRSHFDLVQFWPVILTIRELIIKKSRYREIKIGILLAITTGISNYLGYMTLIFTMLYGLFVFLGKKEKRDYIRLSYKKWVAFFLVYIAGISIFLFPYIKTNYIGGPDKIGSSSVLVKRSLDDFITFSSRPWYLLLTSSDNPFYGKWASSMLGNIQQSNNYLTLNYFKSEHSAAYIGWMTLLLAITGITYIKRYKIETPFHSSALISSVIFLTILSMPPQIIIGSVEVYTPSYILFKLFPMFRVLSRFGVLILFLEFIFAGYGYSYIAKALSKKLGTVVIITLTILCFSEFFVPLKITLVDKSPEVYSSLAKKHDEKTPIVIYPYSKTVESAFWITTHNQPIINPRAYSDPEKKFESESFTKSLNTPQGLTEARKLGAKYLVYFVNSDSKTSLEFFNTSEYLSQEEQFTPTGVINPPAPLFYDKFIKLVDAGDPWENAAILYRFTE